VEIGRVINGRYLLQSLIKQGQGCPVYLAVDQKLQRPVAVKIVPTPHLSVYRAAIRRTAQLTHPNIVGLYDLVADAETFYIIQEYVEGNDFAALLRMQLTTYEVADFGCQAAQALIYAGSPSRRICHGDLTPSVVIRDNQGLVRINDFALPGDLQYFRVWSVVGADAGSILSDPNLPWGQQTDGRRADDTRALGLLLYQLLAGRSPGATTVDPPADGRLRFMRNVPPELCETVARAVIRQHPQHIKTPEALYTELKAVADRLEPAIPAMVAGVYQPQREEVLKPSQVAPTAPGTGKLVTALPGRETGQTGMRLSGYLPATGARPPTLEAAPSAPTVADVSLKLAAARRAAYGEPEPSTARQRPSLPLLLLLGLLMFALFFTIGVFLGHLLVP